MIARWTSHLLTWIFDIWLKDVARQGIQTWRWMTFSCTFKVTFHQNARWDIMPCRGVFMFSKFVYMGTIIPALTRVYLDGPDTMGHQGMWLSLVAAPSIFRSLELVWHERRHGIGSCSWLVMASHTTWQEVELSHARFQNGAFINKMNPWSSHSTRAWSSTAARGLLPVRWHGHTASTVVSNHFWEMPLITRNRWFSERQLSNQSCTKMINYCTAKSDQLKKGFTVFVNFLCLSWICAHPSGVTWVKMGNTYHWL